MESLNGAQFLNISPYLLYSPLSTAHATIIVRVPLNITYAPL